MIFYKHTPSPKIRGEIFSQIINKHERENVEHLRVYDARNEDVRKINRNSREFDWKRSQKLKNSHRTLNHFPIKHLRGQTWYSFSFTSSAHSGFVSWGRKMFGRAIKTVLRRELLVAQQGSQKTLTRTILTSDTSFYKHRLADNDNDIIVYSPLPSLNYPECTIDQYVWNDFNKWSSKTALVRNEKNILRRKVLHSSDDHR